MQLQYDFQHHNSVIFYFTAVYIKAGDAVLYLANV